MSAPRYITALPNDVVTFAGGLVVSVSLPNGTDEGNSITVSINTEDLPERYRYDEKTGMRATEAPYVAERVNAQEARVVYTPTGARVSSHYSESAVGTHALTDAIHHAHALNADWRAKCGMPDVIVFLNDGDAVYDPARDEKPNPYSTEGAESEASA